MKLFVKYFVIVFIVLGGCHSDLYTKNVATDSLKDQPHVNVVSGYLNLRYAENRGVSFSMLEDLESSIRKPLLVTLTIIPTFALLLFIVFQRRKSLFFLLPYPFILAGALGNIINRIQHGYVVDFIQFHVQDFFYWPIFNVADILIVVGIGLMFIQLLLPQTRQQQTASPVT